MRFGQNVKKDEEKCDSFRINKEMNRTVGTKSVL